MIPVDQTILYDPDPASLMGNCFQACVASIFELPLDMVPHFCQEEDWYLLFTNWLEENYGLHPLLIDEGISQSWVSAMVKALVYRVDLVIVVFFIPW